MDPRDEWCFDFHVSASNPVPGRLMDELMCEVAVDWAESQALGVGGGCRASSLESEGAARSWHFRFGLCASEDGQVIHPGQAAELERVLRTWCQERRLDFVGGYRPFTEAESKGD